MSVKLLTEHNFELLSLKRDCTASYESTLVKMPLCWKSPVAAHLFFASSSCCQLFPGVGWSALVIVAYPGHTHLLSEEIKKYRGYKGQLHKSHNV